MRAPGRSGTLRGLCAMRDRRIAGWLRLRHAGDVGNVIAGLVRHPVNVAAALFQPVQHIEDFVHAGQFGFDIAFTGPETLDPERSHLDFARACLAHGMAAELFQMVASGQVKIDVRQRYPLAEVALEEGVIESLPAHDPEPGKGTNTPNG